MESVYGKTLRSPGFFIGGGCLWCTELLHSKSDDYPSGAVVINVYQETTGTCQVSELKLVNVKHYVLDMNQKELNVKTASELDSTTKCAFGFDFPIEEDWIDGDGQLVVVCEFEVYGPPESVTVMGDRDFVATAQGSLARDMSQLLEGASPVVPDVNLVVTGTDGERIISLPAHSQILGARSAVFAAMFHHDLEEKRSGEVVITDVDSDTVTAMLRYIYCRDVSPDVDVSGAKRLLACADKYELTELKAICKRKLIAGLTVDNAADICVLAHLHGCAELMDAVWRFIIRCVGKVSKTAGWETLCGEHCDILLEKMPDFLETLAKIDGTTTSAWRSGHRIYCQNEETDRGKCQQQRKVMLLNIGESAF